MRTSDSWRFDQVSLVFVCGFAKRSKDGMLFIVWMMPKKEPELDK